MYVIIEGDATKTANTSATYPESVNEICRKHVSHIYLTLLIRNKFIIDIYYALLHQFDRMIFILS
jgi:hypothetical protein